MPAPAASKPLRAATPVGELYAEAYGAGAPLLLVAGLGQGMWVWRWVVPTLAERTTTIAYDARGVGRSPRPREAYSIADMADDAATVLGSAEEFVAQSHELGPAHVVGLSMGGYVALTLALRRPELVRSLVLAGTGAGGPGRVPRPRHVAAAFTAALGLPHEEFARRTMPYTFAQGWTERNPVRFEEIVSARLELPTPYETIEAHALACYRFYDEGCEVVRIDVPALVVHGDEDLIVPVENGRRLAERLPNAEYVELRGAGHNLPLEDPPLFARLVAGFVSRV